MKKKVLSIVALMAAVGCFNAYAKHPKLTKSIRTYCKMWVADDPMATGLSRGVSMTVNKEKTMHPMNIPNVQERDDWLRTLQEKKVPVKMRLQAGEYNRSKKTLVCDYQYHADNGEVYPQRFEVKNTQRVPI